VEAVAKLHGSVLELSDRTPGLCVALTIPADVLMDSAPPPALSAAVALRPPAGTALAPSP
jgi:hypothetical protein